MVLLTLLSQTVLFVQASVSVPMSPCTMAYRRFKFLTSPGATFTSKVIWVGEFWVTGVPSKSPPRITPDPCTDARFSTILPGLQMTLQGGAAAVERQAPAALGVSVETAGGAGPVTGFLGVVRM